MKQRLDLGGARSVWGGALVAVAGILAALALVYSNSSGVADVAANARAQQQVESALGATTAARGAIGQALLLAGATENPAIASAGVVDAGAVLESLAERVRALDVDDLARVTDALDDAVRSGSRVLDAIAAGDIEGAAAIATGDADAAFDSLVAELSAIRSDLAESIAAAAAESGRVATASRFMVAFLVPTLAVIVGLVVMRRRRRREALATALEHERAINKNKDQLIANLSHELRTPLTGIYTSALTIEEVGFEDADLAMELTDVIIDQSADLTRMVEDLLVSAQADAGRLRFDCRSRSIADVFSALEKEFGRVDADITWSWSEADVSIDPGRVRQLVRNLVSNAVKYGGEHITVRGLVVDDSYVLQVTDDGNGVPPAVEDRIFERFIHQGNQPLIIGSVGLGLAISKVLAEGMDGTIDYRHAEGLTIFEVRLQLAPEGPVDPSPAEPATLVADKDSVPTPHA